jgi:peptidoglycan/xylan/chitin deacetylase (PgdA/CDA1 family)
MRLSTLALLGGASVTAAQMAPWLSGTSFGRSIFPAVTNTPSTNAVALTFDDGPDIQLERFLELLDKHNARATFFLIGEQVQRRPDAPALIRKAGHEIGVHGMTHVSHLRRTPNDLARDLRRAKQVIEDAGGEPAPLYRPPYGVFSLGSWRECTKQHWERVLWSRWGKDWEETGTPRGIADNIGQPVAGDILLLHDSDRYSAPNSWKNTLGALPIVLDRIAQAGLVARPVGELLRPPV